MNYKIIQNEKLFRDFINWLPDCKPNEQYYITLLGRNKYLEDRTQLSSKAQLKRLTSSKDYIYQKVKQLEVEIGAYQDKGNPIPQEALALYISVNPRDLIKATKNSLKKFADLITEDYRGYNPHSEVLSQIQESTGTKHFMDFDFDGIEYTEVLEQLQGKINFNALVILKTRGGFHLLIKLDLIDSKYKNSWYQSISKIEGCDVKGDNLIPMVGCTQGGFVPHIIKI